MTAREVYFKVYMFSTKPQGMLFYTLNRNGKDCVANTKWLNFDKLSHEHNIGILEEIEKLEGFLFWNISDEADEFLKNKNKKYRQVFCSMAFMQR